MPSRRHLKFIKLAAKQAKHSTCRARVGSIVSIGHTVIGEGYNQEKTHPVVEKFRVCEWVTSLHAELHACIPLAINFTTYQAYKREKASIYIVRMMNDGTYGMARPCNMCMAYITEIGIRTIYYSDPQGEIQKIKII